MTELLEAIAVLGVVGFTCLWLGFKLGRSYEFYYLKRGDNRRELDR